MSLFPFPFLSRVSFQTSLSNGHTKQDSPVLKDLEAGDFHKILISPLAQSLLQPQADSVSHWSWQDLQQHWHDALQRHGHSTSNTDVEPRASRPDLVVLGVAALHAFLQSNVTGPPLTWRSSEVVFPAAVRHDAAKVQELRRQAVASLTVDGEAAYQLTPDVELFCLARCVLNHAMVVKDDEDTRWARVRVNFWHQRMLSENAATLQESIYDDLGFLAGRVLGERSGYGKDARVQFLLERAAVHTYHGFDVKARGDLDRAAKETGFEYALTGRLGKRTKFQEKELSQLVVLAKSAESDEFASDGKLNEGKACQRPDKPLSTALKPEKLDLNDDTLLESISFSKTSTTSPGIADEEHLPAALASLDPANQPVLKPLDSLILLSLASSITNTSPQHGLTREETLPYATRVLEGGSTNWQVYTQALLVRSRIEGYRSRTIERGVLQLQALVDQVIAETTSTSPSDSTTTKPNDTNTSTTFLPRPKPSESASASSRLQYIHPLAPPTRWTLEAELAARWVSLGGLRTALEIYQRLQMWAEAALCWAAVSRDDKARRIIRSQLYHPTPSPSPPAPTIPSANATAPPDDDDDDFLGPELTPLPASAPRLFCILGDLDGAPPHYERAWALSHQRYARAQRSLGKHYLGAGEYARAESAYSLSVRTEPQNHGSWFALGCARLQLRRWGGAVAAFAHAVRIEDRDAEAWSNLAAALLRVEPGEDLVVDKPLSVGAPVTAEREDDGGAEVEMEWEGKEKEKEVDPQRHVREALVALRRAAALNRDSYRIWQNVLAVAGSLAPPPYADVVVAQRRLIELRGGVEGEGCVDVGIVEGLVGHVVGSTGGVVGAGEEGKKRHGVVGLEKMVVELVEGDVAPLITSSRRLWQLVARVALFRGDDAAALGAYEKAWRGVVGRTGWEMGVGGKEVEEAWAEVVDATVELVDAYESLGERRREGEAGPELVCKEWRFKSRSALRGVLGKAKEAWEGSPGWEVLQSRLGQLKST